MITLEEFQKLSKDPQFLYILDSIPSVTTAAELFEALDCTGDGELDVNEFVRGVNLCKAVPTGLDMTNCLGLLRTLREDHNSLSTTVTSLVDKVDLMLAKLGAEP